MDDEKWLIETLQGLRRLAEIQRQAVHWAYCIMQEQAPSSLQASLKKWKMDIGDWRSFVRQPMFNELESEARLRGIIWDASWRMEEEIDLSSRGALERQVVGAIRDSINAHGPITRDNANSAGKRVIGAIKTYNRRVRNGG